MQLIQAEQRGHRVLTLWNDGVADEFPTIWLLHACACEECGLSTKGVRQQRLTNYPARPVFAGVWVQHDTLHIDWGGEHRSTYSGKWLRGHRLSESGRSERRPIPQVWGTDLTLPDLVSYEMVATDLYANLQMLESIRDRGFALLCDVPTELSMTEEISAVIGKRRETNYGIYELKAKAKPEITGDMAVELTPHTDEMYRIDPPAITLFHVLLQSPIGGESILVDGLRLAQRLAEENPEALKTLCEIPARFHRELDEGRHFDIQAPIFRQDDSGTVTGIRLNDRCMAPVDATPTDTERFYDSLRPLLKIIYSGEEAVHIKIEAGQMLIFNNHRLLHGRSAFDSASGRHVRSVHVDLDEFYSRLRVSLRETGSLDEWMRLGPGATA
ncbi:MAG TPA: DUF971 domain-containing protein [Gammaproteobacteria bacterium]|nr:DUF971 domain-containing protein [Gammaproteobacteria bacterium]